MTLSLPEGRYAVRATIVAWDEEPGCPWCGRPARSGCDAYEEVDQCTPSDGSKFFRTSEITFDQPG